MKLSVPKFTAIRYLAAAFMIVAFGSDDRHLHSANAQDIPQTAVSAGFDTLVAALSAAELADVLSAPNGPFTVFAPTNEAFEALPSGLVDCLLQDRYKDTLTDVLLYHVTTGAVFSDQLSDGQEIFTLLDGASVTVEIGNGEVKINDSTVVTADVETDNGVVHVINQVLVPPRFDVAEFLENCPTEDIPAIAASAGVFNTLIAALGAADLVEAVSEPNSPLTVFAPIDDAFAALPDGLVDCLLEPTNKQVLTDVLLYHVVGGDQEVLSSQLRDGQTVETLLAGATVSVNISENEVKINDSTVVQADVLASNGVIHVLDSVLVPEGRLDDLVCSGEEPSESEDEEICTYLGVSRTVGEYLTGPTHTCLCTNGGHWIQCRPNVEARKSIQQFVLDSDDFTTLEAAVVQAGLVGVLDGDGPFTLFAPTDEAFADVPDALLNFLLQDSNKDVLGQVLKYHVTGGQVFSADIPEGTTNVATVQGGTDEILVTKNCYTTLEVEAGVPGCHRYSVTLDNGSNVIVTDIEASNGIIHVIDKVLVPPSLRDPVAEILK